MKQEVLIVDPVHVNLLEALSSKYNVTHNIRPAKPELMNICSDAHGIVVRSGVTLDRDVIDAAKHLTLIVRAGNGMDNIDKAYAEKRGIEVFNVPKASVTSVAEHTFGLLLAVARNIALANQQLNQGIWAKASLYGSELRGKTLGIVGAGAIGTKVAQIANGFGMDVLGNVKHVSPTRVEHFKNKGIQIVGFRELLERSDFVTVHLPLSSTTRSLFTAQEFGIMRSSAILINVARGGVVCEESLYRALLEKQISGAAADVFDAENTHNQLFDLNNFVATPHIGAMTEDAQKVIANAVFEIVSKHL